MGIKRNNVQNKFWTVVLTVCFTVLFSACMGDGFNNESRQLKVQLDQLQSEFDALKDELDALKQENDTLQTLYRMGVEFDADSIDANSLFPDYMSNKDGEVFIIRSKVDFDALFNEERKALYNASANSYLHEVRDFDTDVSYGATDFTQKMLLIYVYYDANSIYDFGIINLDYDYLNIRIDYGKTDPNRLLSPADTIRCFVVKLNKIHIASAEFRYMNWDVIEGKWVAVR